MVKLYSSSDSATEHLNDFFKAEIIFFKDILPKLNEILVKANEESLKITKYFHTVEKEISALIFMEDLKGSFIMHDRKKSFDFVQVNLLVTELAQLHAASECFFYNENISRDELLQRFPVLRGRVDDKGPLCTEVVRGVLQNFADICRKVPDYEFVIKFLDVKHGETDPEGNHTFHQEWKKLVM